MPRLAQGEQSSEIIPAAYKLAYSSRDIKVWDEKSAKEKNLPDDKSVNGVKFLMQHEGMLEEAALNSVKAKVIELERLHNAAFDEWLKSEHQSPELHRYLVGYRLAVGGGHFLHTVSERYGHYDAGGRHCSQHWIFWFLAMGACGLVLALLLGLYGVNV